MKAVYGVRLLSIGYIAIGYLMKPRLLVCVIMAGEMCYRVLFCWTMLSLIHWIINGENVLRSVYTKILIQKYEH